ncbi:hypothetical protein O3P69_007368 [Scylla paramamosain]|uniref:C-type lectin domain-containing protein n=1 Tax=Scylla paramamosain TaxID=85552 RepID=A0AAW0V354_SCYPA
MPLCSLHPQQRSLPHCTTALVSDISKAASKCRPLAPCRCVREPLHLTSVNVIRDSLAVTLPIVCNGAPNSERHEVSWKHWMTKVTVVVVVVVVVVKVSRATVEAETPRILPSATTLTCAIRATHDPRVNLMCLHDACAHYSLAIWAGHDDSAEGSAVSCFTSLSCESNEGTTGLDGTSDQQACQRSPSEGTTVTTTPTTTPITSATFKNTTTLEWNDIYYEESKNTWSDAREKCRKRGGDLLVTDDIRALSKYIKQNVGREVVWLGARGNSWLNGRPVMNDVGSSDESSDDCIALKYDELNAENCNKVLVSLCILTIQYPK